VNKYWRVSGLIKDVRCSRFETLASGGRKVPAEADAFLDIGQQMSNLGAKMRIFFCKYRKNHLILFITMSLTFFLTHVAEPKI